MKVKHLVVAFLCMLGCCACSSPKTEVKSPDGHIKMTPAVGGNVAVKMPLVTQDIL